jgi:uncharacterized protein (TIGR02246 family)
MAPSGGTPPMRWCRLTPMSDPQQVARDILERLQNAFVSKDPEAVAELFDDQLVVFGTAAENLDRTQSDEYVARVFSHPGTVRWGWDQVIPVLSEPDVVVFVVVGTVGFDDAQGQPNGERDAFRLTCVAVARHGNWRLRHFHGSIPGRSPTAQSAR